MSDSLPDVTIVLTSCDRADLLKITLKSIEPHLDQSVIAEVIIIEDSQFDRVTRVIPPTLGGVPVKFIHNRKNIGLIPSIDRAYSEVKTPYIYHCEDDWQFHGPLLIEEQKAILESESDVVACMVRDPKTVNPARLDGKLFELNNMPVKFWKANQGKKWGGMSFNPGLRRLEDYLELSPYFPNFKTEYSLSVFYLSQGVSIAYLQDGHVRHIGEKNSAINKYLLTNPTWLNLQLLKKLQKRQKQ